MFVCLDWIQEKKKLKLDNFSSFRRPTTTTAPRTVLQLLCVRYTLVMADRSVACGLTHYCRTVGSLRVPYYPHDSRAPN